MSKALSNIPGLVSKFLLVGVVILSSLLLHAQDSTRFHGGASFAYTLDDWRFSIHVDDVHKTWYQQAHLGFGIRKTIFQQKFNPLLAYSIGLNLKVGPMFFRPNLRFTYTAMSLPSQTKHRLIQNLEADVAGRIGYGIRNSVFFEAGIGPSWEFKYNWFNASRVNYFYWNYFLQLGFSHAI